MKSEKKCCLFVPARIGIALLLLWSIFFLVLWVICLLMLHGAMENVPDDNFADSWITKNPYFAWGGTLVSVAIPILIFFPLISDTPRNRNCLVAAMYLLLATALIFVAGGDTVMLIDVVLNLTWLSFA